MGTFQRVVDDYDTNFYFLAVCLNGNNLEGLIQVKLN